MTDKRGAAKRLAASITLGMVSAQLVGGPNDQLLAHFPLYAKPLMKGLVAIAFSFNGYSIARLARRRPQA